MNRLTVQFAALLALASAAMAQSGDSRLEVLAAQESARADLRAQVLSTPIIPTVTVRDIAAHEPLLNVDEIVGSAEQIGGPRWVEQDIVQVKMKLAAQALTDRVAALPAASLGTRVSPPDIARFERDWKNRTFIATGQAIPVARLQSLVSNAQPATWRDVSVDARFQATQRARESALRMIVDRGITSSDPNLEAKLQTPEARKQLEDWAATLPATRVVLRDDRQVEVGVYLYREGLSQQLQALNSGAPSTQVTTSLAAMPTIIIGRSSVGPQSEVPVAQRDPDGRRFPDSVEPWMADPINAEATAPATQGKLRTARQAERAAEAALKTKVMGLKIGQDQTIEKLAATDPRIAAAVDRAISRARVYQVDYQPDGSATARVTLDPSEILDELSLVR